MKEFKVITGSKMNPDVGLVQMNSVQADERLTPKLARRAVQVSAGYSFPATVWSNDDHGYRVYRHSARKLPREV